MSDPVSETMDVKAGDRAKANHNGYEHNGGGSVSMRAYPSRPTTGTPLSAKNGSSRAGNDTATPRSESSALSATNGDAKSMDFLTTDVKGQSQYIGQSHGQPRATADCRRLTTRRFGVRLFYLLS